MSRRLLIVNALVGGLGCLFALGIARDLTAGPALPPLPAPRSSQATVEDVTPPAPPTPLSTYHIVATKNPFSPGRSEATVTAAAVAAAAKPVLHGVILDGKNSRAYLEEPPARQVFGYAVGDRIAGGRVSSIGPDRVVIVRPDGPLEVLLQDPSKPKPVAPAEPATPGARGRSPSGTGRVTTPRQAPSQ